MGFLKWKNSIQEIVSSKEEILQKAERAEIIYNIFGACSVLLVLLGLVIILLAPTGSKAVFLAIGIILCGLGAELENSIKSHLKLERYKALWDKMELMECEERKMNAEDL